MLETREKPFGEAAKVIEYFAHSVDVTSTKLGATRSPMLINGSRQRNIVAPEDNLKQFEGGAVGGVGEEAVAQVA